MNIHSERDTNQNIVNYLSEIWNDPLLELIYHCSEVYGM